MDAQQVKDWTEAEDVTEVYALRHHTVHTVRLDPRTLAVVVPVEHTQPLTGAEPRPTRYSVTVTEGGEVIYAGTVSPQGLPTRLDGLRATYKD